MKNNTLILFALLLSMNCFAQIIFENGYFIDSQGTKKDCLIKNIDWKNNPTTFEYKLSESSEESQIGIESVKEFGVYSESKYIRADVDMDRSSEKLDELSTTRNPVFKKERLFLKVLIEGKANLYMYEEGNLKRYFYSYNESEIEQLIYKSYSVKHGEIRRNRHFQQQVWNNLKCPSITNRVIENLEYKRKDLINFFSTYDNCHDGDFTDFNKRPARDLFNLSIRPGLDYSTLSVYNEASFFGADFDNEVRFRLGLEAEFVMPFNKNKWSIIVEPTFNNYESEGNVRNTQWITKYNSIELPIGLRHYFFINDRAKVFINAAFVLDFALGSAVERNPGSVLDIGSQHSYVVGAGYKNNKIGFEIRYLTNREILKDYLFWRSEYNSLSLIFGYSIL